MATSSVNKLVQRACVVCGAGSTRATWVKSKVIQGTQYVACDGHSDAEFQAGIDRVAPKPVAPATPVPTPSGGAPPVTNGGTKV